jgi:hypothetical protein
VRVVLFPYSLGYRYFLMTKRSCAVRCGRAHPPQTTFHPTSLLPPLALLVPIRRSPTPTPPPPSPARAFPPQSPSSSRRPLPPAAADSAATRFMARSGARDAMAPARDQMSSRTNSSPPPYYFPGTPTSSST